MGSIEINIIIGMILFLCSVKDIKKKEISYFVVIVGGIAIFLVFILGKESFTWSRVGGGVIGIIIMAISKLTKGQIGMGDGIVLFITGIGLGMWNNFSVLAYGLFFAAVFSFSLLLCKKISRKDTVPFVPFIFLGYISFLVIR